MVSYEKGRLMLTTTLSLFKDLETGARGFSLTGDEHYLEPFQIAKRAIPSTYDDTKRVLSQTENGDVGYWTLLDRLVALRIEQGGNAVQERMKLGRRIVDQPWLFAQGKATMGSDPHIDRPKGR